MNKKLFLLTMTSLLLPSFLLAAENFESYSDATALRQVWREFDAGNPAPETVEIGSLNGKALRVTARRNYSLLWREINIPYGTAAAGVKLTVRGDETNPGDAVMTVVIRTEKNGTELGRKVIPLCSARPETIAIPAKGVKSRDRIALLLMFNKTGGTVTATVDDIGLAERKLVKIDGFDRVKNADELRREWPEFDAGNPAPEKQQLIAVKGEPAMRCSTGSRTYAVLKRQVASPPPGTTGIVIRLAGLPGNAKSGVIVLGARRNENEANFAEMQIVPPETPGKFTLNSPNFNGLESFLVVLSFHKTAGQFDVQVEEVALEYLD